MKSFTGIFVGDDENMINVSWEQAWGTIITAIVATLIKVVFTFLKEQKKKHEEAEKQKNDIISALMENNQELIAWRKDMDIKNQTLEKELHHLNQQIKQITDSDLIILKDRILQSCRYFISKGYITVAARENITEMYNCYRKMGGNGTGKIIYEQAMELKIKDVMMSEDNFIEEEAVHHVKRKPISRRKKKPESEQNLEG